MRSKRVVASGGHQDDSRRSWSWVRFAFGFVPFGFLLFFDVGMPFFDNFLVHVAETTVIAIICGVLTARFGDVAFKKIVSVLRWL
jgi:hypothetical protein